MKSRSGFTLVELVLLMVIVGCMAVIALPRLDVANLRVRSAERTLATTLLRAQQMAVTRQHEVHVLFDTVAGQVLLHEDRNNDGVRDAGEAVHVFELEAGVRITRGGVPAGAAGDSAVSFRRTLGGLQALTFQRNGSASEAGGLYLGTVRNVAGRRPDDARMLVIDRATGRVERFHLEAGAWRSSRD